MASPFLNSEEYDECAHRHYNDGDYDRALDLLKEGLSLYPNAVDLHVGLGYTRLAREEFAWARQAFDTALLLEADHEDALVGLGEVFLRLGRHADALTLFGRVPREAGAEPLELLLSMGRALYRERLFEEARQYFEEAIACAPDNAEAQAALAYTLHRTGRETAARRRLLRALALDPKLHEARIYLGHLCYDGGQRRAALQAFEAVPPGEHWDCLALWRLLELKQSLEGFLSGDPALARWESRLDELQGEHDEIDELLAGLDAVDDAPLPSAEAHDHRVRLPDGQVLEGSWPEIVLQLRNVCGEPAESIAQFMRRQAGEHGARAGVTIPDDDPEEFLRASALAGLLRIDY